MASSSSSSSQTPNAAVSPPRSPDLSSVLSRSCNIDDSEGSKKQFDSSLMEEEDWEWRVFRTNLIDSLKGQLMGENERLLVPACKDIELSLRLYDEGFHYITSLVKSHEDYRNIFVAWKEESWKGAKDILWKVNDMKNVDDNNMYFAIVDKDVFRHLSNHDHDAIESYVREVTRLLRRGGSLYCFTPHFHSLDLLFTSFSVGWSMEFYFAIRDNFPVFFVRLNMMGSQLPFPIQPKSNLNDSENVRDKINIENKRRLKGDLCVSKTIKWNQLFELVAWNEVQPSDSEMFRLQFWFEDFTHFRHLITVHDIKAVDRDSHVSLFLVTDNMQKHDILNSEEQRCLIKAVPDTSCRLIVVCVGPNLNHEKNKDAIMMYFERLLDWLGPVACSTEITPWIRFLGHSHIKKAREKSKLPLPLPLLTGALSPLQAAASSIGASTSSSSSSGDTTVILSHVASLAAQTPPESTMLVSSKVVDVEKKDVSGGKLLVEMPYDTDLKEWLSSNKERWSNEHWNKLDSRRKNKTDSIPGWNALRPTEKCAELIQGILKALVKLKQKSLNHGYLDDPSNYKLSFFQEFDKGILRDVVNVYFVHCKEEIDINRNSHEWDMKSVIRMVFDVILEGVPLPRIWESLYVLMDEIVDETKYSLKSADQKNRHLLAIQDHYCCWKWIDRVSLYERFWSVLKWGSETSHKLKPVVEWIIDDISCRIWEENICWHRDIPLDSPWRRLFIAQNIGNNGYQQLRYIRGLLLHYKELNVNGTKRYFKDDETIDENDEYVELLICECFYPFVDLCCLGHHFYTDDSP